MMSLRPVDDNDHEWLVELHNDPMVLRNLTHPQPIVMDQHLAWWHKVRHDRCQLRLIFEIDGVRAGLTKFYDIDWTNENCILGADLHRAFRGKGLAKLMWTLMLERCFNELSMHRVSLTTAEYNVPARRTYQRVGFKEEGRLTQSLYRDGEYHDQITMYMLREDWLARVTA